MYSHEVKSPMNSFYDQTAEEGMQNFYDSLSEKDKRRYAAVEVLKLPHGGKKYISHLLVCDLVTKHQFGKNLALFEKSYTYKQHDHLICLDCDKVLEFCDPRIQQIQTMMGDILDFQVTHHSLNLFGKCRKLLENKNCEHQTKKKQITLT